MYDNDAQNSSEDQSSDSRQLVTAFSNLVQELRGLIPSSRTSTLQAIRPGPLSQTTQSPASLTSPLSNEDINHGQRQRKRRRVDSCGNPNIELVGQLGEFDNASAKLPAPELLEDIITAYFNVIQPWIPILHETRFRSRFYSNQQLPQLTVLLHAMVVAAIRFVDTDNQQLSVQETELWMKRCRSIVVLSAMDQLSVENLQALSIIAFSDVSSR